MQEEPPLQQTLPDQNLASTAMLLGVVSIPCLILAGVLAVLPAALGAYTGLVALYKAYKNPALYTGKTMAGWAIALNSILALLAVAVVLPSILTSQSAAREAAVVRMMLEISIAEDKFRAGIGKGSYGTLKELDEAGLIDSNVARGGKAGYRFEVRTDGKSFSAVAKPMNFGRGFRGTGIRSFYVDQTGKIRETSENREATINDEAIE